MEVGCLSLALPNCFHPPALCLERDPHHEVALSVAPKLLDPELLPRTWDLGDPATLMVVPEAAMHEDDRTIPRENDVRPTGKVWSV